MLQLSEGQSTNLNRSANTGLAFATVVNSSVFSSFNRIRIFICCWLCFYRFFLVTVKFTNATVNTPATIAANIFNHNLPIVLEDWDNNKLVQPISRITIVK